MTDKEEVVDKLLGNKEFYVDFNSWYINARDRDDALKKAKKMLHEGDIPEIGDIQEA